MGLSKTRFVAMAIIAVAAAPTTVAVQSPEGSTFARNDWPLICGWTNSRYSTLDQINTETVSDPWGPTGTCGSREAPPRARRR